MELNEILSVAMADAELENIAKERTAILDGQEQRKAEFETADVDRKEALANESETANQRFKELKEREEQVNEIRSRLEACEKEFSLTNQLSKEKVERRNNMDKEKELREFLGGKEYRDAWANMIRFGTDMPKEIMERTAITSKTEAIPLPTEIGDAIQTAWKEHGLFSNLVTRAYTNEYTEDYYSKDSSKAQLAKEDGTATTEGSLTLGVVKIDPDFVQKFIVISKKVMVMSTDSFIRYVKEDLVNACIDLVEDKIFNGQGSEPVVGILATENESMISKVNEDIAFNTHNLLRGKCKIAKHSNAIVAMNEETFYETIMGMKDSNGRPLYSEVIKNDSPVFYLGGLRVEFTDSLKPWSACSQNDAYMIVGDFKAYKLNTPSEGALSVTVDDVTLRTNGPRVRLIGDMMAGGNIIRPKAFAVATKKSA